MDKSVKGQGLGSNIPYSIDWYIVTGTSTYNFYFKPKDYMGNYCSGRYLLKAYITCGTTTSAPSTAGTGITTYTNMTLLNYAGNVYDILTCGANTNQYALTIDYATTQYLNLLNAHGRVLYSGTPS